MTDPLRPQQFISLDWPDLPLPLVRLGVNQPFNRVCAVYTAFSPLFISGYIGNILFDEGKFLQEHKEVDFNKNIYLLQANLQEVAFWGNYVSGRESVVLYQGKSRDKENFYEVVALRQDGTSFLPRLLSVFPDNHELIKQLQDLTPAREFSL